MTTVESVTTPREPAGPVMVGERIISLDVLRGFAILGILIMNIQSFSMIGAAYLNPTAAGALTGVDRLVWTLGHLLADLKFMAIFSMLFGAGIVLFASRLESRGVAPGLMHYRRIFWLLIIGLAHGFLLWYGDILTVYSLVAIVAYLFWRRSPLTLVICSALLFCIPALLYTLFGYSLPHWPPEAMVGMTKFWAPTAEVVQEEIAAYTGGWMDQMGHRVFGMIGQLTMVFWSFLAWRVLALMLLGMALFKWGWLSAERSRRLYGTVAVLGLILGFPVIWMGVVKRFAVDWAIEYAFFQGALYNYWGSILVALAYVSIVMLIVKTAPRGWFSRLLAPVGRMAFTNYLLQTVLCTTLFYGHGFGLFGSMGRVPQLVVVLTVWVLEIWLSHEWLSRFRFGPAEWAWRTLTYMRAQPMRRAS